MRRLLPLLLLLRGAESSTGVCSYATPGNSFDLSPLRVDDLDSRSYTLDNSGGGEYSYVFNVCGPVTPVDLPRVCSGTMGAVLQYKLGLLSSGCWIGGKFEVDGEQTFKLIDEGNPAKGVSLKYANGGSCSNGVVRSTTLDVYCANTEASVKAAYEVESRACSYHITMESWYGCPTECGLTAAGLCNSHGSCATDKLTGSSYCSCDAGYSGDSCATGGHLGELDNDIINSLSYMYSADTETGKWKGNLLLLLAGMAISMALGLCFVCVRSRYRRSGGYAELEAVSADAFNNGKDGEDESVYFMKGVGV
jgi:Glucosidase II beta subunit-like protein